MNTVRFPLPIDETLTPQNAAERGYRWTADIAYDPTEEIPVSFVKDLQAFLDDGYKLGCPLHPVSSIDKGVYKPLEK